MLSKSIVEPMWPIVGKTPFTRDDIIKRIQEHEPQLVMVSYPEGEKTLNSTFMKDKSGSYFEMVLKANKNLDVELSGQKLDMRLKMKRFILSAIVWTILMIVLIVVSRLILFQFLNFDIPVLYVFLLWLIYIVWGAVSKWFSTSFVTWLSKGALKFRVRKTLKGETEQKKPDPPTGN